MGKLVLKAATCVAALALLAGGARAADPLKASTDWQTSGHDMGGQRYSPLTQITSKNVGKRFAIVLDNQVITAPTIQQPITGGTGQITGNFTSQSANDLAVLLRNRFGQFPGFQLHENDALEFDLAGLAAQRGGRLRVIGNLPYNISTPLLFHLLRYADRIADMHFMLQKEVVDRMAAEPGDDDYGRLTVALAARAHVAKLFTVGPGAFRPAPKVDSAIVRLVPRPPAFEIVDHDLFDRIVAAAFSQRRKTLANGLKTLMTAQQISEAGIDPGIRAERLSAADFASLTAISARA